MWCMCKCMAQRIDHTMTWLGMERSAAHLNWLPQVAAESPCRMRRMRMDWFNGVLLGDPLGFFQSDQTLNQPGCLCGWLCMPPERPVMGANKLRMDRYPSCHQSCSCFPGAIHTRISLDQAPWQLTLQPWMPGFRVLNFDDRVVLFIQY